MTTQSELVGIFRCLACGDSLVATAATLVAWEAKHREHGVEEQCCRCGVWRSLALSDSWRPFAVPCEACP